MPLPSSQARHPELAYSCSAPTWIPPEGWSFSQFAGGQSPCSLGAGLGPLAQGWIMVAKGPLSPLPARRNSKACAGGGAGEGSGQAQGAPVGIPTGCGEGRPHLPAASLSRAVSGSGLKAWVGAIKLTPSPRASACSSINGTNSQAWNSLGLGLGHQ